MSDDGVSTSEVPMRGIARQIELTTRLEPLVGLAVEQLAMGDAGDYLKLISPSLIAEHGEDLVRAAVEDDLLPFFAGCVELSGPTTVMHTTDPYGNDGLSFYKHAVTEVGERRPFAIWIVEESGHPVVAGLLPGASYESRHRTTAQDDEPPTAGG